MKSSSKQKKGSKNKSISKTKDKPISKTKNNLKTIKIEPYSKFKNELFQKLFDNNIAYKERVNTYGNAKHHSKNTRPSPLSTKYNKRIVYKYRNPSYFESSSKDYKKKQMTNSKLDNNTFNSNINSNSTHIIKSKRVSRPKNSRKLRDYPNLIKGVLHQVNYYNINNNINYNDNIRYKPIDDFSNEQSSIFFKNIIENNTNSPNISINFDFKQEPKSGNQSNNNITNPKNSLIESDIEEVEVVKEKIILKIFHQYHQLK